MFWSNDDWGGSVFYNSQAIENAKAQFSSNIVRAAMGIETSGGYFDDQSGNLARVEAIIQAAIDNDMYVIIDWHTSVANTQTSQSAAFFQQMASKWGKKYDNIIYEIFNEPTTQSWSNDIKPYAETVISAIRQEDPNNLIIVGNPTWSQEPNTACADRLNDDNVAYTLHF
eukprot:Pgem_evm1s14007